MSLAEPPVWLITGCSTGFGYAIAKTALLHGHRVIASSRNLSKTPKLVADIQQAGGHWIELDVTSSDVKEKVEQATKLFGRIDIAVNNAGYMMIGACEDLAEDPARAQFDVNFFGPFNVIKAVLPGMRERRTGTIINMSSGAGIRANAGLGMYASSKFALEALSESLSHELADFNIRILIVEPGPFRTTILGNDAASWTELSSPYRGTSVETLLENIKTSDEKQVGDVWKGAERIFETVTASGMAKDKKVLLRLPLGAIPVQALRDKARHFQDVADEYEDMASNTALDEA